MPNSIRISALRATALSFVLLLHGCTPDQEVVTVAAVFGEIEDQIRQAIERAEDAGNFLLIRAGQEALLVLEGMSYEMEGLMDEAFLDISVEHQKLLNEVRRTVTVLEEARVDTLKQLREVSDQYDRLFRDLAFKTAPVIYRYSGGFVVPGGTQPVTLRMEGYNLTRGAPRLILEGRVFEPLRDGHSLLFTFPREMFTHNESLITRLQASFTVKGMRGGFFGYFQEEFEMEFPIGVTVLPQTLGKASLTFEETLTERNSRTITKKRNFDSSSRKDSCKAFSFSPSDGKRSFLPAKTKVQRAEGNNRGWIEGVRIHSKGVSFKICAKRRLHEKDNGFRHVVVTLTEIWDTQRVEARAEERELAWNRDETFLVGKQPGKLLLRVLDFTGNQYDVPDGRGEAGPFVKVTFAPQSGMVHVSPRVTADLFKL